MSTEEYSKFMSQHRDSIDGMEGAINAEHSTAFVTRTSRARNGLARNWKFGLVIGLLSTLIVLVIVDLTRQHTRTECSNSCKQVDFSGYVCAPNGSPPEIAKARGCTFDDMSFHWWPSEAVLDPENQDILRSFHEEGKTYGFRGMKRWGRFYDNEGKFEIPPTVDYLTTGYVTRAEHIHHCKYALRQTHLWMIKGYDVPFNYTHTKHCTKYLVDTILENPPKDWDELVVHGTPWPENPSVVKPYYPCQEEGLSCQSW